jgi:restriction system protein
MDLLQFLWEIVRAVAQILWVMWPITAVLILMGLTKGGVYLYKTRRYAQAGITDVDNLSGKEFEQYLETLFKKLGYQVQRTPYQGDYGADLVLRHGDEKTVVQAKRYHRNVGVKAVQEAVASKEYYRCDKMMVVTNSRFTRQARILAKANQVELWNRDELVSRLISSKKSGSSQSASSTDALPTQHVTVLPTPNASTAPSCARCGKQVSAQVHRYCANNANIFHGSVYCYDHQQEIRGLQAVQ